MRALRALVFATGLALVGWTLLSAIRTVVLPRSAQSLIARVVFRSLGRVFRLIAGSRTSFARRDRVMALFSPIALLVMAGAWVILVDLGYTLMYWSVQDAGWSEAFFLSGSSLLTLGFAPADSFGERILAFSEATIGLARCGIKTTRSPLSSVCSKAGHGVAAFLAKPFRGTALIDAIEQVTGRSRSAGARPPETAP